MVSAIGASVVAGLAIHDALHRSALRWWWALVLSCLLIGGNLAGIYVENRNYMFGEKVLVEVACNSDEPIYTDPMTLHRARLLLRWNRTTGRVMGEVPVAGSLYVYNLSRAARPNGLMSRDAVEAFQPRPDWKLEREVKPSPKFTGAILEFLGLDTILPGKIVSALGAGHPGVRVYRLPPGPPRQRRDAVHGRSDDFRRYRVPFRSAVRMGVTEAAGPSDSQSNRSCRPLTYAQFG